MTSLALTQRPRIATMTDARTATAHLITDHAAVTGRHTGRYRAICGELVLAASLTTPERRQCQSCARWLTAW